MCIRDRKSTNDLKKFKELYLKIQLEDKEYFLDEMIVGFVTGFSYPEIIEFLLKEGANPNKGHECLSNGNTLHTILYARADFEEIYLAYKKYKTEEDNNKHFIDIIGLLIKYGANINQYNDSAETPLDVAIRYFETFSAFKFNSEPEVKSFEIAVDYLRKHGGKTSKELEEITN